jgi:hypothetical protein
MRREAEKKARAEAGPSRSGIMSRVHRLLADLESKQEQVRFQLQARPPCYHIFYADLLV